MALLYRLTWEKVGEGFLVQRNCRQVRPYSTTGVVFAPELDHGVRDQHEAEDMPRLISYCDWSPRGDSQACSWNIGLGTNEGTKR